MSTKERARPKAHAYTRDSDDTDTDDTDTDGEGEAEMFGRVEDTDDEEGTTDEEGDSDGDGAAAQGGGGAGDPAPSAFESLHKRKPAAGADDADEAALSEQGIEVGGPSTWPRALVSLCVRARAHTHTASAHPHRRRCSRCADGIRPTLLPAARCPLQLLVDVRRLPGGVAL